MCAIQSSVSDHSMAADQVHVCTGPVLLKVTPLDPHRSHFMGDPILAVSNPPGYCTCTGKAELLNSHFLQ